MTTPATKLRAARDLISDPGRWCQEGFARNARGERCQYDTPDAVQWCAVGACMKSGARWTLLTRAALRLGHMHEMALNDTTDHPTVMRMFDLAIELAEKEG